MRGSRVKALKNAAGFARMKYNPGRVGKGLVGLRFSQSRYNRKTRRAK